MIIQVAHHFAGVPVTVLCDSWFENDGLRGNIMSVKRGQSLSGLTCCLPYLSCSYYFYYGIALQQLL